MKIEAQEFELKMTHADLWNIAHDIAARIRFTVKDHWIHHPNNWQKNEAAAISRARQIFVALGRPEIMDERIAECQRIIDNHAKSQHK